MNLSEALVQIKAAFVTASGLPSTLVVWQGEALTYVPADSSLLTLSVTSLVGEGFGRVTEGATTSAIESPYVLTVQAKAENLQHPEYALWCLTHLLNGLQHRPWLELWRAAGVVFVDFPLRPTRVSTVVDGREVAVFAADVLVRVVLKDTFAGVIPPILTVEAPSYG